MVLYMACVDNFLFQINASTACKFSFSHGCRILIIVGKEILSKRITQLVKHDNHNNLEFTWSKIGLLASLTQAVNT